MIENRPFCPSGRNILDSVGSTSGAFTLYSGGLRDYRQAYRPGDVRLLLQLLLDLAAHVAGGVVHLADLGEQRRDLVTAQEARRPPLQHVTQARLDGTWYGGRKVTHAHTHTHTHTHTTHTQHSKAHSQPQFEVNLTVQESLEEGPNNLSRAIRWN